MEEQADQNYNLGCICNQMSLINVHVVLKVKQLGASWQLVKLTLKVDGKPKPILELMMAPYKKLKDPQSKHPEGNINT